MMNFKLQGVQNNILYLLPFISIQISENTSTEMGFGGNSAKKPSFTLKDPDIPLVCLARSFLLNSTLTNDSEGKTMVASASITSSNRRLEVLKSARVKAELKGF